MDFYIGLDWGGTYIKTGLVDGKGKIVKKEIFSSVDLVDKQSFLSSVKSIIKKMVEYSSNRVRCIGIGAPGIIDPGKGKIYYLPNIPGWENYPLAEKLSQAVNLPVFIDNDANIFGLAEVRAGAAKGFQRALFLTLGTGLGGVIIYNGKILEGHTTANELGHVPISLKGNKCGCGGYGCIETYVGNKYLLSKYFSLKKKKENIEVKDIYFRAKQGEKEALQIWKDFSLALGKYLAGIVNIFSLQIVVFGGGVSGAFSLFKPMVWEVLKNQAMWPQVKNLKLVRAKLKFAGIVGAALRAKESLEQEQEVLRALR